MVVSWAPPSQRPGMLCTIYRYAYAMIFQCRMSQRSRDAQLFCELVLQPSCLGAAAFRSCECPPDAHSLSGLQAPWTNGFTSHAYRQACAIPEAWDLHAAWRPWAELPDPVSSLRLELTWRMIPIQVNIWSMTCLVGHRCTCTLENCRVPARASLHG